MMAMGITKWQYGYYELIEKRLDPPVIPIRYPWVGFSVRILQENKSDPRPEGETLST